MALGLTAVAHCICGDAAPQNGNGDEGGRAVALSLPPSGYLCIVQPITEFI